MLAAAILAYVPGADRTPGFTGLTAEIARIILTKWTVNPSRVDCPCQARRESDLGRVT